MPKAVTRPHRERRGVEANCWLQRRTARLRGEAGADRDRKLSDRRDISGDDGDGERRVVVLGRIDQAVESGAIAASRAMGGGLRRDIVMSMNDMGDGIQRERQQQADEGDS
jgi:hypothetical protein